MYEIIAWIYHHRNDPLTVTTVVAFILLVLDKLGRNLINHQLKRLFHIRDKSQFAEYAKNQQRIEMKLDVIAKHMGVGEWNLPQSSLSPAKIRCTKNYFSFSQPVIQLVNQLRRRKSMNTNTTINYVTLTISILGAIKIILQSRGYDIIDDNQINAIANAVGVVATIVGVVMSHRKPKTEGVQPLESDELSYTPGNNR